MRHYAKANAGATVLLAVILEAVLVSGRLSLLRLRRLSRRSRSSPYFVFNLPSEGAFDLLLGLSLPDDFTLIRFLEGFAQS